MSDMYPEGQSSDAEYGELDVSSGQVAILDNESNAADDVAVAGRVYDFVYGRWDIARKNRWEFEDQAHRAYLNFRGRYHEDIKFRDTEESRVFIKVTKTKAIAAWGMINEIMFPNNNHQFPVFIQPTPVPEYVEDTVHFDPKAAGQQAEKAPESPYGFPGDGKDLKPGDTHETLMQRLGALTEKLAEVTGLKKGPGVKPGDATFHPAQKTADNMNRKMQDQFLEGGAHAALESAGLEAVIFGTGIIKGPFSVTREHPYWEVSERGLSPKYAPVSKQTPTWEHLSFWDFYPDPDATPEDLEWAVVRRRVSKGGLFDLKNMHGFREDAIDRSIEYGYNYTEEWWEDTLRDNEDTHSQTEKFVIYEYWGSMTADEVFEMTDDKLEIPDEYADTDMYQVNAWVCNGETLKFVVNPYRPQKLPFHIFLYERNPYSFFGIGIGENMSDTQTLMNGFMRLAVENAALSGNIIIEVDDDGLVPGQDLKLSPGKIIRRHGGAPGQSFFAHKIQNVSQENMQLFDKARQLSDESTGLPSFAHGQTGVQGVGRTASGISQLMGAAGVTMKATIRNFNAALNSMGHALFYWNMQKEYDPETHGDLQVKVRGTDALMSKEVRTQRVMTLMQVAAGNPALAPHVKWRHVLGKLVQDLDFDDEEVLNSPSEAMLQAELSGKMGGMQLPPQERPQVGPGNIQGKGVGTNPNDSTGTGGGNIGIGAPRQPGDTQFSGRVE